MRIALVISALLLAACQSDTQEQQVRIESDLPEAHSNLTYPLAAEIALSRGENEQALELFLKALNESPEPEIAERATRVALYLEEYNVAKKTARIWAQDEQDLEAQKVAAALDIRADDGELVLTYFERIENLASESPWQHFGELVTQGDDEEVNRLIKYLEKFTKSRGPAKLALAQMYMDSDQAEKAMAVLDKIQMRKENAEGLLVLKSQLLYRQGDMSALEPLFNKAISLDNENLNLHWYYVQFLLDKREPTKAKSHILELIKRKNMKGEWLLAASRLAFEQGWHNVARRALERAIEFEEQRSTAYYFLGRLEELENKPDAALKALENVENGPFVTLAKIRRAQLLLFRNEHQKALDVLENTTTYEYHEWRQVVVLQAEIYLQQKKYKRALSILNDAIKEAPEDVELLFSRAVTNTLLGNNKQAETELLKVIKADPNHFRALNAYGFMLIERGADESYSYLSRAFSLSPTNPAILDSLGWWHHNHGTLVEARDFLERALQIQYDEQTVVHLYQVYKKMGQKALADDLMRQALEISPNSELLLDTK